MSSQFGRFFKEIKSIKFALLFHSLSPRRTLAALDLAFIVKIESIERLEDLRIDFIYMTRNLRYYDTMRTRNGIVATTELRFS